MKKAFPILGVLTAILLSYALYEALVAAPTEQTMGDVQRIFYYHVPSAWTAFLLFFINFMASIQYLVRPHERADRVAVDAPSLQNVPVGNGSRQMPAQSGPPRPGRRR